MCYMWIERTILEQQLSLEPAPVIIWHHVSPPPPTGSASGQTCDLSAIGIGIPHSFPILPNNNWRVNEHTARR